MTLMRKLGGTPLDMHSALVWEQALAALNKPSGWDYSLSLFDGWRLQISAGTSEEAQHPIAFLGGVSYLSCPLVFSHPRFRLASGTEMAAVRAVVPVDDDDQVLAIDAETMAGTTSHVFFIVAQSIELVSH